MDRLIYLKGKVEVACSTFAGLLMIAMSIIAVWQVVSRYVLNSPSTNTEEALRYLMIWMGFFGATYCFGRNTHLSITLLENKLNPKNYFYLKVIQITVVCITILISSIYGGYHFVVSSFSQYSPTLGISMSLIYAIIPVSGLLILFLCICNLLILIEESREGNYGC
ncbi:TRAP transporter small permease [Testudinibacter sp. P80/BLE/0925]|uniref:TRAP transporter small permease n=1 Tax=Testudinibacter sp. TW-1 TaxID=3417757 RepID=UPI003D36EA2E